MGGNGALAFAMVVYISLCVMSYFNGTPQNVPADTGICLPPPRLWNIPGGVSLILNIALTLLSALWLAAINRLYNFISSTSVIYVSVFLFMAGANPHLSCELNASTLLLAANVASLWLLFGEYGRSRINPASIFIIGTLFSLGSMVHYSFLFFIVIYACSALLLKTFGLRELIALLAGVLAPYWIVLGTGIIPISQLHIPLPGGVWEATVPKPEMVWLIISSALTAFVGIIIGLRNTVTLYNASTAIRAFYYALTLPAFTCVVLLVVDWENFLVYYLPLSLFAGIEYGYLSAYGHSRNTGAVIYWSVAALYTFIAVMSIYNGLF